MKRTALIVGLVLLGVALVGASVLFARPAAVQVTP